MGWKGRVGALEFQGVRTGGYWKKIFMMRGILKKCIGCTASLGKL